MGVQASHLKPCFRAIAGWSIPRAQAMVKEYTDEEHDFGIDYNVVASLTKMVPEEAKSLVSALARSETGIINAVTLMISVVCLAENGEGNIAGRIEQVFDIMDFDGTNQITIDEMTILLFCTGSALGSILDKPREVPSDAVFSKASLAIFEALGKKTNVHITKSEFITWAVQSVNGAATMNAVFDVIVGGLGGAASSA